MQPGDRIQYTALGREQFARGKEARRKGYGVVVRLPARGSDMVTVRFDWNGGTTDLHRSFIEPRSK